MDGSTAGPVPAGLVAKWRAAVERCARVQAGIRADAEEGVELHRDDGARCCIGGEHRVDCLGVSEGDLDEGDDADGDDTTVADEAA